MQKLAKQPGIVTYNLGTGRGYSVIEIIKAFEQVSNKQIPYRFSARRDGDLAAYFADASLAYEELNWQPTHTLASMVESSWLWQSTNPNGYND